MPTPPKLRDGKNSPPKVFLQLPRSHTKFFRAPHWFAELSGSFRPKCPFPPRDLRAPGLPSSVEANPTRIPHPARCPPPRCASSPTPAAQSASGRAPYPHHDPPPPIG